MIEGLLGRKVGMTQIFSSDGRVVPVTVIEAGPCYVTQIRTVESDGYQAVQIGFGETKPKRLSKAEVGHLQKAKAPSLRHLREVRASAARSAMSTGTKSPLAAERWPVTSVSTITVWWPRRRSSWTVCEPM